MSQIQGLSPLYSPVRAMQSSMLNRHKPPVKSNSMYAMQEASQISSTPPPRTGLILRQDSGSNMYRFDTITADNVGEDDAAKMNKFTKQKSMHGNSLVIFF